MTNITLKKILILINLNSINTVKIIAGLYIQTLIDRQYWKPAVWNMICQYI